MGNAAQAHLDGTLDEFAKGGPGSGPRPGSGSGGGAVGMGKPLGKHPDMPSDVQDAQDDVDNLRDELDTLESKPGVSEARLQTLSDDIRDAQLRLTAAKVKHGTKFGS